MKLKSCIITIAAILLSAGCSRPVKDYSYINLNRLKGWYGDNPLTLTFDMVDTTNACELYIVGEIAIKRSILNRDGYPINITLIAPDGMRYKDSVTLPLNVSKENGTSRKSHGVQEIVWPYRKNIYNKQPGSWTMVISKGKAGADYSNIIGLGVHCRQNYEF